MLDFLVTLHVVICVFLVLVILLQKFGSDSIANIGSSGFNNISKSVKPSQAGSFLTKVTVFFALAFMLNSVFLANLAVKQKKLDENLGAIIKKELVKE